MRSVTSPDRRSVWPDGVAHEEHTVLIEVFVHDAYLWVGRVRLWPPSPLTVALAFGILGVVAVVLFVILKWRR